ncbi:MAG: aminotransferase class V-fold PLP-dependent enzyme [Candidatus Gracilibacteria bacterium]|nr:aminotransferase class V-fold PLP-dependent enzyme [Candidatus Gracilibacteria bacterium]
MSLKKDFPIFKNNPGLVFLDSTASSQKPAFVIDGIKDFLENDYSNIHRGSYVLSERSENVYENSKKKVASFINADYWREVVYTYNSNYALNFIAGSLRKSEILKKGDKVLVSIVEHHANIVPWLILIDEIGIELEYINVDKDYNLDLEDLKAKLDDKVKVVSITQVSNVTGQIFDLEEVGRIIEEFRNKKDENLQNRHPEFISGSIMQGNYSKHSIKDSETSSEGQPSKIQGRFPSSREGQFSFPLFIIDASQSFPHFKVDVKKLNCDMIFFTAHKIMADSGLGVWWAKKEILDKLKPVFSGGGAIAWVKKFEYKENTSLPDKFELGTPNITGALSLLKALEYVESIGGYEEVEKIEKELVSYTVKKWLEIKDKYDIRILGSLEEGSRVGVFSFIVPGIHSIDLSDMLAEDNICIRAGQHCAEPFLQSESCSHTCRMSLYIYNDKEDIDRFFEALEKAINVLK